MPPTAPPSDGGCTSLTSSPARFDAGAGRYAAYLTALDVGARTLGFDVIQYLRGAGHQAKMPKGPSKGP